MKPRQPIEADRQPDHDRGVDAKTQGRQFVSQRVLRQPTLATAIGNDLMNLLARIAGLQIDPRRVEMGASEVFPESVKMAASIATIATLTLFSLGLSAYTLIVP